MKEVTSIRTATKAELVNWIVKEMDLTKREALKAVNLFLNFIKDNLKEGKRVQLIPFGTFEVRERRAREGRNPRTGEKIFIEAKKTIVFRPGKGLKKAIQ